MEPELWEGNFWHWEIFAHWLASKDCILHMAALCFSLTATLLLILCDGGSLLPTQGDRNVFCFSSVSQTKVLSEPSPHSQGLSLLVIQSAKQAPYSEHWADHAQGEQKPKPWGLLLALASRNKSHEGCSWPWRAGASHPPFLSYYPDWN